MDLIYNGISIHSKEHTEFFLKHFQKAFGKGFTSTDLEAFREAVRKASPNEFYPNLYKSETGGAFSFFPKLRHKSDPRICAYRGSNGAFIITGFSLHNSRYSALIARTKQLASQVIRPATTALKPGVLASVEAGLRSMRAAGKGVGKTLLKKVPLIGTLLGASFATERALRGDYIGAGLELTSGVFTLVPGWGTAASFATDMTIVGKDVMSGGR